MFVCDREHEVHVPDCETNALCALVLATLHLLLDKQSGRGTDRPCVAEGPPGGSLTPFPCCGSGWVPNRPADSGWSGSALSPAMRDLAMLFRLGASSSYTGMFEAWLRYCTFCTDHPARGWVAAGRRQKRELDFKRARTDSAEDKLALLRTGAPPPERHLAPFASG